MQESTSTVALAPPPAAVPGRAPPLVLGALLAGVGAMTAVAVAVTGLPAAAAAPTLAVAVAWVVSRLPLRWSAAALLAAILAVDDHGETYGQWRTPLATLGDALHNRLDLALGVPGARVTGLELALAGLFAVWLLRRARGDRTDTAGHVEAAAVVRDFLIVYVAGVALAAAFGVARGLPFAPWKLRNLLHPILLAALFLAAFRGPRDHALLGRVVVFAACARAILALVVQRIGVSETGGRWESATSHGDSILFAVAAVLLVVAWLERPDRRAVLRLALLLPLVLAGAEANERRLVWPMIGMGLGLVWLVAPARGWKRTVTHAAVLALPLVALYVGVGWNRGARIFGPVQTLRSMADPSIDRSAYWREVETWNIAMSMRWRPLTGTGLGGEYTEYMPNDSIADAYKEYREWPHNTVLGLLLLMGLFAFSAQWALLPLAVFLAARAYRRAPGSSERVAAAGCLAAVAACLLMAWGDTGAHYPQYKVFAALAVAVSAKLAVATGAWPARARDQRAAALAAPAPRRLLTKRS